jgi:hypothetical protein
MKAPTKKEMANKNKKELIQMLLDAKFAQRARDESWRRVGKDKAAEYLSTHIIRPEPPEQSELTRPNYDALYQAPTREVFFESKKT